MKRMQRIREKVVARIVSADDWWQDDEQDGTGEGALPLYSRMGRQLSERMLARRHKIIEHVLFLASELLEETHSGTPEDHHPARAANRESR